MSALFEPLPIRSLTFAHRIAVSPMCQYSCREDGLATDWHLVHLGRFATGGAALVLTEATAVSPEGRITPHDLGIWTDAHGAALAPVARFLAANGAVPGIQLAHAGRKASTEVPWRGGEGLASAAGGWVPVAPSDLAFSPSYPAPRALDEDGIARVIDDFVAAARRAHAAGFRVVELHFAHGYLVHQFLSPLVNRRTDRWGGDEDGRTRLALAITAAVRAAWPAELPLFVRLSVTDHVDGGWDVAQSVRLARRLGALGVDLIDCSSGGAVPGVRIAIGPGYQVPLAEAVRTGAGVATAAVGLITEPAQAEQIVAGGQADLVLLARAMLRDPLWPLNAAAELGVERPWPVQYERARPKPRRAP